MDNRIEQTSIRSWKIEGVTGRQDADPELKHKFFALFGMPQTTDNDYDTPNKPSKVPEHVVNAMSESHRAVKWDNAEVIKSKDALSFKLLNGPMTGLEINAQWISGGVQIDLKPKNRRQHEALLRIMPKIDKALASSPINFIIEVKKHA
ncbi:hypothetical protein ACODM8_01920 [Vibrio ostreicida]|uniref:hypothetical protein n=1 Tax=Vibrio ostreicida TaxID=526588 RepID=UPI003B597991